MKKILWLASWFPDKIEPLSGDFIERHARAVSLLNDITVIHVVKDHTGKTSAPKTIERKKHHAHLTIITAYYKSNARFNFARPFFSTVKNFFFQKQLIDEYIKENGKPDLINVHICYKAGLGALYSKWRYGIKYIVSEQWTIFCPEAKPSFRHQTIIARSLISRIYRSATHSSAVSEYLSGSLAAQFGIRMPVRIPNVVDTELFYPSEFPGNTFSFIHISTLNYQKNPGDIIEAVRLLMEKTDSHFEFIVYGPIIPALLDAVKKKGLERIILFRGEVMQDVLSAELRRCNALVLYSRFETFGCVIIEAFASGVPVIVSDIPVMRELVEESKTGTFVPPGDAQQLANRMLWVLNNNGKFSKEVLREEAGKYAFDKVAKSFDDLYNLVLKEGDS